MTPVLVTPPADVPVSLAAAKAHLRVSHGDEDALIGGYLAAAVAYLDGWRGVLGRAIMAQTWRVAVTGAGPHVLPMPDVTVVTATAAGTAVAVISEPTAGGLAVTLAAAADPAFITFTCAMPQAQRELAAQVILLLVGHWYQNREAVVTGIISTELPLAADALIGALRWRAV
jgi:uncharacterized phiE125 gp8 family phage protein